MIVLSYGGGVDSTALLVEAHRRGLRPDLIVWADTGSEHPRTYDYLSTIGGWLSETGLPPLLTVRWTRVDGRFVALHEACIANGDLPSAAYGLAGCSSKWKRQPLDKAISRHPAVQAALSRGEPVERWVGYSADEEHRLERLPAVGPGQPYHWRAPLAEWGIDRAEARQIIRCAGLPLPGKSACWCCPHSRPAEVRALAEQHPELAALALQIEQQAASGLETVRGLGRSWRWADLLAQQQIGSVRLVDEEGDDLPCGCST